MPHVGTVLEGRTFFCPHCGAFYSATPSLVPKSEGDAAKCVVCFKIMDETDRTKAKSFKLIHRPEMCDGLGAASDCRPRSNENGLRPIPESES